MSRVRTTDEYDEDDDGLDIRLLFGALRRRWRLIAGLIGVVAGLAAVVILSLPRNYSASVQVRVGTLSKEILDVASVVPALQSNELTIDSEIEMIKSRTIAERVIDDLNLRSDPEFAGSSFNVDQQSAATADRNNKRVDTLTVSTGSRTRATPQHDAFLQRFARRLEVKRVRETRIISIQFSSRDPVKAARIANAFGDAYVRANVQEKENATRLASSLLAQRVQKLGDRLARAEKKYDDFKTASDIFDTEGHSLLDRQLSREMETLVIARGVTAQAHARSRQAERLASSGGAVDSVSDVLTNHTVRWLRDAHIKAVRRAAELRTRYGVRHPKIARAQADVREARLSLHAEIQKIVSNLKSESEIARNREQQLETAMEKLKARITKSKDAQAKSRQLRREVEASRALYKAMLARQKQMAATAKLQSADVGLVAYATVPRNPVSPKRSLLFVMAVGAGMMLSICLALALEFLQGGFAHRAQIARTLDHEPIGAFPELADTPAQYRTVSADPMSPFAEASRGLRHEIDARGGGRTARTIVVASALPDEGRSLIAANLAQSYAMTGQRTLLVDGDLRLGHLSARMSSGGHPGLFDVIRTGMEPLRAIITDRQINLNMMPAMANPETSSFCPELLEGDKFASTLKALKAEFDIIIIDAPPLLPVVDGRILAHFADQVAFVTTWRRTPRELALRGVQSLGPNQAKIAGVVINRVGPRDFADISNFARGRAPAPRVLERHVPQAVAA